MSKKKVLIAEGSDHYKILEQIFYLLNDKCSLSYYIIESSEYNYKKMFPSSSKSNIKLSKFRGILFFFGLIKHGKKYDLINISTGPEGDHFTDFLNIIGFYFCSIIYGKKIILTIRNIRPYLSSTPGLYSLLRNYAINNINRFTFETLTMKKEFYKLLGNPKKFYSVSYDRYPDTLKYIADITHNNEIHKKHRIGLLGSLNNERRDYNLVVNALSLIPSRIRNTLEIVIMGECKGGKENPIIKKIEKLVCIDCVDGILSEVEFASLGKSCDLLLAPLLKKSFYGTLKGSGSVGDAIYLKKKLIIPLFVDPYKEFKFFCSYYSNSKELSKILTPKASLGKKKISNKLFAKYETKRVFNSLIKELDLVS